MFIVKRLKKIIRTIIKNTILCVINIILLIIRLLTKIDKNKVVYIPVHFKCQGNAFSLMKKWSNLYDNYKHYYLCEDKIKNNELDFKENVYICKFGFKFLYHFATARYLIRESEYNSVGLFPNKKTIVVQLWHGAGAFKKFGLDIPNRPLCLKFCRLKDMKNWDLILCSSKYIVDIYSKAFGNVNKERIEVCGLPRNDILYKLYANEDVVKEKLKEKLGMGTNGQIILYAPTFRDKTLLPNYNFIIDTIQYLKFNINNDNIYIGIRFHSSIPRKIKESIIYDDKILDFDGISTEEALILSDMLITDYSSIIFDFALLEKPMIFYAPDFYEYYDKRGFYFDYEQFVPGPIAYNSKELLNLIFNYNKSKWLPIIKSFKEKFNPYFDGKNSERIIKKILSLEK